MKLYHVLFVAILVLIINVFLIFVNNKSATANRAYDNAELFAIENNISVGRLNCTGDGNGNGYGTCTIVSSTNDKTHLECTSGFIDVKLWKATGCKEKSLIQFSE